MSTATRRKVDARSRKRDSESIARVVRAVEPLVQSVDRTNIGLAPYEAVTKVVLRLAFLLAAERRTLLPNGHPYCRRYESVSLLAVRLRKQAKKHSEEILEHRCGAWNRVLRTIR